MKFNITLQEKCVLSALEVVGLSEGGTDEIPGSLSSFIHSHSGDQTVSDMHRVQRARISRECCQWTLK